MIRQTISSLDAAGWLDKEVIESAHLPRWTKPQKLSPKQAAKMRAGYNATRAEKEALRSARFAVSQGA